MEWLDLIMMNFIIGLFTGIGFAYLAHLIKYRNEDYAIGAAGGILVSACFQAIYISTHFLCEKTVVMIVLQIIIAVLSFRYGWHDNDNSEDSGFPTVGAS